MALWIIGRLVLIMVWKRSGLWPPPPSVFKVNIDGAVEGKTRLKAIGAVFHNASGEVCIVFSSPIKVKESNDASYSRSIEIFFEFLFMQGSCGMWFFKCNLLSYVLNQDPWKFKFSLNDPYHQPMGGFACQQEVDRDISFVRPLIEFPVLLAIIPPTPTLFFTINRSCTNQGKKKNKWNKHT